MDEENIKILKKFKNIKFLYGKLAITQENHKNISKAIENVLKERKHDKARIKELEKTDLTSIYIKGYEDGKAMYRKKIQGKIDELNKTYEDSRNEDGESEYYYPDYTIRVLQELLEDKGE